MEPHKLKQTFQDKTLVCVDCNKPFIFTAGEAAYFWSKQLSQPKRCQACRELRKRTLLPQEV